MEWEWNYENRENNNRSGMKPTDRNPVTETRHRDQNFYPGLQDYYVFNFVYFGFILWGIKYTLSNKKEF